MANNAYYAGTFNEDIVCSEDTGSGVVLTPGMYVPIGKYVVKADERVGLGRGGYDSQNAAIGHLFAQFFDNTASTPVQITNGKFRVLLESSQGIPIGGRPVWVDVDLNQIATGKDTPSERYAFPFEDVVLSEDRVFKFLIKNNGSTPVTLSKANSKVICDVTRVMI